ncbi:MAG: acyl-CoA dehydrogenase [Desulfatibacillaceae bacterium]
MAQVIADRRDIDFVLYEQLGVEELCKTEKYGEFNKKVFGLVLDEARNFAVKEILPTLQPSDEEDPARWENNQVFAPKCYHRPYELLKEGEWIAMTEDPEVGGQGFPHVIGQAGLEYIIGASFAFAAYGLAGHGTAKMVEIFGTDKQKELYLRKLYSGEWTGTMVLTEPEAGSDLGALTATAVPQGDGTYLLTGNKIFITNGDHDLAPNIVHPVLARIEGAPAGTKGISLFLVPKYRVNDDGSLGEHNDVVCTGIEHKMGLSGSATCQLAFGQKGACQATLLGEENKGLKVMFYMMNEARLAVGAIGHCNASTAYLYAVNYCKERKQGKDIQDFMNPNAETVSIIRHPDVRRMLMWMKAHVDGMRSLILFGAFCFDKVATTQSDEEREKYQGFVDLLTPIIKSYCSDKGFDAIVQALQCYGGYGYTRDYPIEQILRDSKINSIYEGTNGIQAMDLLGRKLAMKKGAVFMSFLNEINRVAGEAKAIPGLEDLAAKLEQAGAKLGETAMNLGTMAMSEKMKTAFSHSKPFLDAMGDVCMAWMLLWRATVAAPKLEKIAGDLEGEEREKKIKKNKNGAFYDGQLKTARYFINTILPMTMGMFDAISAGDSAIVDMHEESFNA